MRGNCAVPVVGVVLVLAQLWIMPLTAVPQQSSLSQREEQHPLVGDTPEGRRPKQKSKSSNATLLSPSKDTMRVALSLPA